jgi:hypothetical protein
MFLSNAAELPIQRLHSNVRFGKIKKSFMGPIFALLFFIRLFYDFLNLP